MLIDDRFLKPNPQTVLWFEQRKLCLKCKHMKQVPIGKCPSGESMTGGGMTCLVEPSSPTSCSNKRNNGPCGTGGNLFESA